MIQEDSDHLLKMEEGEVKDVEDETSSSSSSSSCTEIIAESTKSETAATTTTTVGKSISTTMEETSSPPNPDTRLSIRLTYFNGAGRAELSRLILSAAGLEFEDRRLETEEWTRIKPTTPFSQVPVLEYEGETIGQSMTIARFLAKKTGMYGRNELEQARVDSIVDYVADYNNKWVNVFRASSFREREELVTSIIDNFLPVFFRNLQDLLKKSGGKYFAGGDSMTIADIAVFQILQAFTDPEDPFFATLPCGAAEDRFTILDDFPLLQELKERVYSVPGIKRWVDNRPRGLF